MTVYRPKPGDQASIIGYDRQASENMDRIHTVCTVRVACAE